MTGPDPQDGDENEAPTATITSPSDGASFAFGDTITFEGSGHDPEDGSIAGSDLTWESSVDGEIGTGGSLSTSNLSAGHHNITLRATDSEGKSGVDWISIEVVKPASVELEVKLPRPDLEPRDSALIANREAVVLSWQISGTSTACRTSGNWSGEKSSSGRDTTEALEGPANLRFIIQCENSLASVADTVFVDVGAPGERHATSNRPDITDKKYLKFFYIIDESDQSRDLDLNGAIEDNFKQFQERFADQTGGRKFRIDKFENGYDITFVVVDYSDYPDLGRGDAIRRELQNRGLGGIEDQVVIKIYDSHYPNVPGCGAAWNHQVTVFRHHCKPDKGSTVGHEIVHAHNLVDKDAPNNGNRYHVTDHDRDLMDTSAEGDFILDYNRDDYYNEDGLPDGIKNLAESPFLTPKN